MQIVLDVNYSKKVDHFYDRCLKDKTFMKSHA